MPDSLEFPRVRRAIVPLMGAWNAFVLEFVAEWLPSFPAIIRTLNHLPKPTAVLRGIKPLWVSGRPLEMEYLPAGKMGPSNLPLLANSIGSKNEGTLARSDKHTYAAHLSLSPTD